MATSEKNILNRMYLVAGAMFLFAFFVAFKLINIQVSEGDKYKALAEARTERMFTIPANRGNLYAGDGSLLATSVPKYDIRFDALAPTQSDFEQHVQGLAKGLSAELGKPVEHYISTLRKARVNKNRYLLLARNLGYSKYLAVKKLPLFNKGPYKGGIITEQRTVREHPLDKIAERTIGYDRLTEYGRYSEAGLEGAFGTYLRGKEGKLRR